MIVPEKPGPCSNRKCLSCRGSVGFLLIVVSFTVFLILPLLTGLTRSAYSQLLVLRAGALIDETLPSASLCLDLNRLAEGGLSLDSHAVDQLIRSRLAVMMPSVLTGRMEVVSVQVSWRSLPSYAGHWLGENQPDHIPVVSCTVRVSPLTGEPVLLTRSVQLLQTPD